MDYTTIQKIARGVVDASSACDGQLFTGTVTGANPLKIQLGEESGSIEIDGDDIILTQSVVSKKLYIEKHDHKEDEMLGTLTMVFVPTVTTDSLTVAGGGAGMVVTPTLDPNTGLGRGGTITFNHTHRIHTSTLDTWVTEYGHKLPRDPSTYNQDGERVVITINRGLEVGDKVIMTRVSSGQQFVVLSRYFEVDKQGEDDE